MKLFFLAHAAKEESPRSVLMRTAYNNGYRSVTAFARHLGAKETLQPFHWQMQHSRLIQRLGANTQLNGSRFIKGFYSQTSHVTSQSPVTVMGLAVPAACIRVESFPFCPECLKDGFHRFTQDLTWLDSCPFHRLSYVSACPECERPIRWTKLYEHHCKCGYDLRQTPTRTDQSVCSQIILGIFRRADQAALDRFMFCLNALRYSDLPSNSERSAALDLAATLADSDANSFDMTIERSFALFPCLPLQAHLAPWAASSDAWIKAQIARLSVSKDATTAPHRDDCRCDQFYLFHNEICHALNVSPKRIRGLMHTKYIQRSRIDTRRWKYFAPKLCQLINASNVNAESPTTATAISSRDRAHDTYLTVSQAAIKLGLYADAVRSAIKTGLLQQALTHFKGKSQMIECSEFDRFTETYIFVGQLAADLGLPKTTLTAKLIHCGIAPISGPSLDRGLIAIYRRSDLTEETLKQVRLLKHYETNAGRKAANSVVNVTTSTVPSSHVARILNLPIIHLKHLQDLGYLDIAKSDKPGRHFTTRSVENSKRWLQSMISLPDCAKLFSLSSPTFSRRFIQSGFLSIVKIGNTTLISRSDIQRIQKNVDHFLTCFEADKELGAPLGHANNLVRTGRLIPATEVATGGVGTVILVHRSDIEAIRNLAL